MENAHFVFLFTECVWGSVLKNVGGNNWKKNLWYKEGSFAYRTRLLLFSSLVCFGSSASFARVEIIIKLTAFALCILD